VNSFHSRETRLVPVLISDLNKREVPSYLKEFQFLDLRKNFEENLSSFLNQINYIPKVDFSLLNYQLFENLTKDILSELGFSNIKVQPRGDNDVRYDLSGDYGIIDPFGKKKKESWIIECKFYQNEKADFRSLRDLSYYLLTLKKDTKLALFTNSQLTSTSLNWLNNNDEIKNRVRIIDGYELKNILINHPRLIKKYFEKRKSDE
jgi:hypothetical protein